MTYAILFTNFEVNYTTLKLILFVFNRLPRHQHKINIEMKIPMEKILITNSGRMIIFSNEEDFTFFFLDLVIDFPFSNPSSSLINIISFFFIFIFIFKFFVSLNSYHLFFQECIFNYFLFHIYLDRLLLIFT